MILIGKTISVIPHIDQKYSSLPIENKEAYMNEDMHCSVSNISIILI